MGADGRGDGQVVLDHSPQPAHTVSQRGRRPDVMLAGARLQFLILFLILFLWLGLVWFDLVWFGLVFRYGLIFYCSLFVVGFAFPKFVHALVLHCVWRGGGGVGQRDKLTIQTTSIPRTTNICVHAVPVNVSPLPYALHPPGRSSLSPPPYAQMLPRS